MKVDKSRQLRRKIVDMACENFQDFLHEAVAEDEEMRAGIEQELEASFAEITMELGEMLASRNKRLYCCIKV